MASETDIEGIFIDDAELFLGFAAKDIAASTADINKLQME